MLVNDCVLRVSQFCGDPVYHIFCYHKRKDDFEVVGDFKQRENAESVLREMLESGGNVLRWLNAHD
jgi:hypothetical protein